MLALVTTVDGSRMNMLSVPSVSRLYFRCVTPLRTAVRRARDGRRKKETPASSNPRALATGRYAPRSPPRKAWRTTQAPKPRGLVILSLSYNFRDEKDTGWAFFVFLFFK